MNCTRAKIEIALWVGHDLDREAIARLERHVVVCPACRLHLAEMRASVAALHEHGRPIDDPRAGSLWPSISSRLASERPRPSARFNGWVPAVAVAAIFLAMVSLANSRRPQVVHFEPRAIPVQGASFHSAPADLPRFFSGDFDAAPEFVDDRPLSIEPAASRYRLDAPRDVDDDSRFPHSPR